MIEWRIRLRLFKLWEGQCGAIARRALAIAGLCLLTTSFAQSLPEQVEPDIDLYALMSGKCSTLKIGERDFTCRTVAYFHTEKGRADFTVPLNDPTDESHIISFSGENGHRTQTNLYVLTIDRMLLKSKERPKMDGLPVPLVEASTGMCRQLGSFASGQISSISCHATDQYGRSYEVQFESDGSPVKMWRVRPSRPTIQ